jgi:hypothetical protein
VELARCPSCLDELEIRTLSDASICSACRRVITGSAEDVKVCSLRAGVPHLLCSACARRLGIVSVPRWPTPTRTASRRGRDDDR